MNKDSNARIDPWLLAERFAAAERGDDNPLAEQLETEPRWRELLLSIQWFSFQPGGIAKLAKDLLAAFPERVLTRAMKKAGSPGRDGKWTLEQALLAWECEWRREVPYRRRRREWDESERVAALALGGDWEPKAAPASDCTFYDWLAFHFDPGLTAAQLRRGVGCDRAAILDGLQRFNHAYFKAEAVEGARALLPGYLRDLCTLPDMNIAAGPSWFPDVIAVLFDFMDWHAAREKLAVAETEVRKALVNVLDDTWKTDTETDSLGRITGRTGFGKTESLNAECLAYPGRWRMFEAPLGDSLPDLIRAAGESLGMTFPRGVLRYDDRQKVEFCMKQLRLGIVIDEAHRLCPQQFNRNSVAERYNWVRWAIVDRKLPCVLSVTFQTDKEETTEEREARFVKTTGFNMEQFTRRITMEKSLPAVLSHKDFMAVAKHHCGNLKPALLDMLVDTAMASPGGLGVFERVKLRAARLAERRGSQEVAWKDFEDAIAEVPGISAKVAPVEKKPAKPARQPRMIPAEVVRELRLGGAAEGSGVSRFHGADRVALSDITKAAEWAGAGLPAAPAQAVAESSDRGLSGAARKAPIRRGAAADDLPGPRGRGAVADILALAVPA